MQGREVQVARTEIGGITYGAQWFQYCGVQTYPGLQPDADQDNYFRYAGGNVNEWQRDLEGEYFSPNTDLGLTWYERRPMLYHHGLDGDLKAAVIGTIDRLHADETGVWAEGQLDLRQRYIRAVQRLVDRGALSWSSGSLPHLVEVATDGHIKRWPIVEGSLTPTPAEPRHTDVRTVKSAFDALGIDDDGRMGPAVSTISLPISAATMWARVVLPRPGGPESSTWSS